MAAHVPALIADPRVARILDVLQDVAAGDLQRRLEISPAHDELDAIAHAINVLGGELDFMTRRLLRLREEAEQASVAKTMFLRDVSHEIRTPLSAILGAAQLLQMPGVDAARREDLLARIVSNVHAQAELLNDLLDLSQVESGKLTLDTLPTPVGPLLDEVARSLEPAASGKGVALAVDIPDLAPALAVLADRLRLRQILVNLIGNAIKFTGSGSVVARAGREEHDVVIDVVDTGPGIDAARAELLFQPFTQGDPGIASRFGGSGLGLALARRLAREMGGDLALLASAPGKGATFRLRLPAWEGGGEAATGSDGPRPPAAEGQALDGVRVLVVDDHEAVRGPLAAFLEMSGATVMEASGGLEAVEVGARAGIDVILMDVRMPDIDGLEASRRLRARGVHTPIVALTADVVATHDRDYASAGCNMQLAKLIDTDRLVAVLHSLAHS